MVCAYVQFLISSLNEGQGIVDLTKSWNYIMEQQCKIACAQAYELYENYLEKVFSEQQSAMLFETIYDKLQDIRDLALEHYFKIAGIRQKNQFYQQYKELLFKQIDNKEQQIMDTNEQMAQNSNTQLLQQLTQVLNSKLDGMQYKASNVQEFLEDFSEMLNIYDQKAVGTQKAEILIDYLMMIHPKLIKSFIRSIEQRQESKSQRPDQPDQGYQQEQEQLLKNNITLIQEKIKIFEEKVTKLEQDKQTLEN